MFPRERAREGGVFQHRVGLCADDVVRSDEMARGNARFVAYRSEFLQSKTGRGRSAKYYLIEESGEETLAAYADESTPGDSHYTYKNHDDFTSYGTLTCHNRKALHAWLDEIVRATSGRVTNGPIGAQNPKGASSAKNKKKKNVVRDTGLVLTHEAATDVGSAGVTSSTTKADGSAKFVNYSQEKFTFPDGRRGMRFYVIDEAGAPTLAVLGEERETRDGHYQYKRVDTFTAGAPLRCGNLSGVHKWLKDHIAGGQLVGVNFPFAGAVGGGKEKGGGSSAAALARKKRGDIADGVSLIDPMIAFQAKVEEREAQWAIARRASLAYVREPTHPDHLAELDVIIPVLKSVKNENKGTVKNMLAAIDAFKALSSIYVSIHTLDELEIKDVVVALQKHPNETIALLAKKSVQQWLGSLYSHVGTLASVYHRPITQPPRHKVGYGPPKEEVKTEPSAKSPTASRQRAQAAAQTPNAAGSKRAADALPGSASKHTPAAKMQRNSAGLPGSTPVGKGHKLCPQCSGTCGSPTRVCPHCGSTLPYKQSPKVRDAHKSGKK